jgi:hypothetical protein
MYDMNPPKIAPIVRPKPMFLSAVPQAMPTVVPIPGHSIAKMGNSDFFSVTFDFLTCIICLPFCLQPNDRHKARRLFAVALNALVVFFSSF